MIRKQFASPVVPPSIPAWQLQSQRTIGASTQNDGDKNDDNGSADGSGGSSETEVVTKHSDSSLELMLVQMRFSHCSLYALQAFN